MLRNARHIPVTVLQVSASPWTTEASTREWW